MHLSATMRVPFFRSRAAQLLLAAGVAVAVAGCGSSAPTSPTLNEGSDGGGDAKEGTSFTPFLGHLNLTAATWDRIVEGNAPRFSNAGGFLVAPIPASDRVKPSLNYLFSPANRDLAGARSLEIDIEIVTTAAPVFLHDGGAGLPASVRAFFWSHDLKDQGESARWWNHTPITLAPGASSISVSLDPAGWSNVNGKFGTDVPETFAAARAAMVALGLTLGGGSSFGHGVSVTGGTADLVVKRYEVR